jgi:hypothetical protein
LQVKNFKPRVIPKDAATNASLERSLGKNILFSHLDDDERKQIFDAMELHECKPGDVIIKQGTYIWSGLPSIWGILVLGICTRKRHAL